MGEAQVLLAASVFHLRILRIQQVKEYLDELAFLAETAGAVPVKRYMQKLQHPDSKTYIGKGKALLLNALSASTTLPGAVLAYLWLDALREAVPYILAVSAASFIYIATADLIPGLHRQVTARASLRQLALMLAGIATIAFFRLGA